MEALVAVLGIAVAALAGAAGGYSIFPLAQRDPRTPLPASWRFPMTALTALLAGLGAATADFPGEVPLFMVLPVFGVLLAAIDLRSKLLPNALLLPFAGATAAVLGLAAVTGAGWQPLSGAALGAALMFGFYLLLALMSPAGMGMGDVKLAAVLGLYGGYAGLLPWLITLLGGFLFGGLAGLAVLLSRRGDRHAVFPFGPGMLLAAFLGTLTL
ncbi:prepilin peptidase [Arthrobacter sp. CAN_A214]|uniref:prepilin peptidase n=1 Tax=Arthrobacter sp. CAN_A214 TaxID=2787720 RepID=UPI0018C9A0EC